jgi:hypothetical protein
VNRYASTETMGGPIGPAHRLQINNRDRRSAFELDIAAPAIEPLDPPSSRGAVVIQVIGEAKATRLDLPDLARLDRITDLLADNKRISPAPTIKRLLFSLDGFTADLSKAAHRRHDVELVGLDRLYEGG